MRRILLALCALCLLLTGCSGKTGVASSAGEISLTRSAVLSAYDTACEAYNWFDIGTMPLNADDEQVLGDLVYRRVNDPKITTLAELKAYLSELFVPEIVEKLLNDGSEIQHYRDFDGALYALDAARGCDINLLGKTAAAEQVDDTHWTVMLTFYADSYAIDPTTAVIGYSQTVLNYVRQNDGQWRFTNFCSSDNLDENASTVFLFNYQDDDAFSRADYLSWDALKIACWLLHADGAFSEGPGDALAERLLSDPAGWFASLSVFPDSPWENAQAVMSMPAGSAAAGWFTAEQSGRFQHILDTYQPKNGAEQTLLEKLRTTYKAMLQSFPVSPAAASGADTSCLS